MPDEFQSITIFRNWIELAGELPTDADRGKFYHAICKYSIDGIEPDLTGILKHFFVLIKPVIDKSNKRRSAQHKGVQIRLQNGLQNESQTELQNGLQNESQTELHNVPRACDVRVREEKKRISKDIPKEKISFVDLLPAHLHTETMQNKWLEWEAYRRKQRKTISEAAAKKQMLLLQTLSEADAIAAIDQSIANDYQGLFPPKNNHNTPNHRKDYTGV